jgi:pimeloyl-ACP methyl ester carboxylesterase
MKITQVPPPILMLACALTVAIFGVIGFANSTRADVCRDNFPDTQPKSSLQQPEPRDGSLISVRGNPIYFRLRVPNQSRGLPTLMLGGLDSDISTVDALAKELQTAGGTVLSTELNGQGRTLDNAALQDEIGMAMPIELENQIQDILRLLASLGIEKYNVMGLSYGGAVATELAKRDPRVANLVLVSSYFDNPENFDPQTGAMNFFTQKAMSFWGLGALHNSLVSTGTRIGLRMTGEKQSMAAASLFKGLGDFRFEESLAAVKADIFILHAKFDPVVPIAGMHYTVNHMPEGHIKEFRTVISMNHDMPSMDTSDVAGFMVEKLLAH